MEQQKESLDELLQKGADFIRQVMKGAPNAKFEKTHVEEVFSLYTELFFSVVQERTTERFRLWTLQFGSYPSGASIYTSLSILWRAFKDVETPDRDNIFYAECERLFQLGQINPYRAGEKPIHNVWVQEIEKLMDKAKENNPVIKPGSNSEAYLLGLQNAQRILLGETIQ